MSVATSFMPMDAPPGPQGILCPSAKCETGVVLVGVVEKDGTVSLLQERLRVDAFFTKLAREGRTPEKRFRFADTCQKSGCQQWTGHRCGLIDKLVANNSELLTNVSLPHCSIREGCRWHLQIGSSACAICPHVITDMTETMAIPDGNDFALRTSSGSG